MKTDHSVCFCKDMLLIYLFFILFFTASQTLHSLYRDNSKSGKIKPRLCVRLNTAVGMCNKDGQLLSAASNVDMLFKTEISFEHPFEPPDY